MNRRFARSNEQYRRLEGRRELTGADVGACAEPLGTRVRVGDGKTWANNRHLPGEEVWLVGEGRSNGERKYYLSNLSPRPSLRGLAAAIKARWVCEQGHRQLKQELGLGHFEGRSWTGLHRHALMACMAFAWLQHLRLAGQRSTGLGKNAPSRSRTTTIAEPACPVPRHHGAAVRRSCRAHPLSALQAQTQLGFARTVTRSDRQCASWRLAGGEQETVDQIGRDILRRLVSR